MNSQKYLNQDYHFESEISDHDSEIESRLYAEIHYSNRIIGDDNDLTNSGVNNESGNDSTTDTNKSSKMSHIPLAKHSNLSTKNNNVKNLINVNNTLEYNYIKNINCTSSVNLKEMQSMNISNKPKKNLKPQKRALINDNIDKPIEPNKKQKKDNSNERNESHNNLLFGFDNSQNCNQNQEINCQKTDTIVNPYSNKIMHNSKCLPLLSHEFLNLLFGNKSKSKKKKVSKTNEQRVVQSHKLIQISKENKSKNYISVNVEEQNEHHKVVDNPECEDHAIRIIQNNIESVKTSEQINNLGIDSSNISAIIDISSESSNDAQNNSKYDNILQTDQKLKEKESEFQDSVSEDSTSDSEESIFEVPVPPKPPPPLIDLKDSNSESESESEKEQGSEEIKQNNIQINNSLCKSPIAEAINDIELLKDSVYNADLTNTEHETDEFDNITLNCTDILKGASSLTEIKQMSLQSTNKNMCSDIRTTALNEIAKENYVNSIQTYDLQNTITKQQNEKLTKDKDLEHIKKVSCTLNNKKKNDTCRSQSSVPIEEYFFQPMTDKMKKFYNDSWGGENFDIDYIQSKMSRDRKKWTILNEDVIINASRSKRYFGMMCNRCQKYGHRTNQCEGYSKTPVCHMCGNKGHYETTCPHKKCLTCGKKQIMYRKTCESCKIMICRRCNSRGHQEFSCPDLWRRFHQTVNQTDVSQNSRLDLKPKFQLFCCNCAKRGHLSVNCHKLRWSQHFPIPSHIISYNGPAYIVNNINSSKDLNSEHESSSTLNSTDDALLVPNVSNSDSIKLKSACQNSNHLKKNKSCLDQGVETHLNVVNDFIIFQVSSNNIESRISQKIAFDLIVPNLYESSNLNSWTSLILFLKMLKSSVPSSFILQRKHSKVQMLVTCPRKYVLILQKFIKLYASRNNFERSRMLLTFDRDKTQIYNCIVAKLKEVHDLTEDPLQLYEELIQLNKTLENKNQVNNFLLDKLALCEQKLLLTLYKHGFSNGSPTVWKKMLKKLKFTGKSKKQKSSVLSFKSLVEYLYNYNRTFVPHQPSNLISLIDNYKAHLERRDRLKNDPFLFPEKPIVEMQSKDLTTLIAPTSTKSISSANTIQELTTPTLLSIKPSTTSNINSHVPDKTLLEMFAEIQNSQGKKKNKVNILYRIAMTCKKPLKKEAILKKFQQFIKDTKNLIAYARTLNLPQLQNDINILEKKMENELCVHKTDYNHLKQLVEKAKRKTSTIKTKIT